MPLLTTNSDTDSPERQPDYEQTAGAAEAAAVTRLRVLSTAAMAPLITVYLAVAALLAVVTASASAAQFSTFGVLAAAGPGWLAVYQVPLQVAGQPLGLLPLLATIGVSVLTARTASSAAQRMGCHRPSQVLMIVGVMTGAHALFGLTLALAVGGPVRANPGLAFAIPGLLAGVSALVGVVSHCQTTTRIREYLDPVALRGLRAGVLGMSALLACGAVVFLASLVTSFSTARDIFTHSAPGAGSGFGMFLLSLGYLPNAVIFALAFVAGPGFSIGSMSLVPYSLVGGPVPGVPLLAGLPEQQASWWPFLMVLPAAAGLLVGWFLRRSHERPLARIRAVLVAGALVGFASVVLGSFAGGRLGGGAFDPVSLPVGLFSVALFFWIVVPGTMVAWIAGPRAIPAEPAEDFDGGPETVVMASIDDDFEDAEEPNEATNSGENGDFEEDGELAQDLEKVDDDHECLAENLEAADAFERVAEQSVLDAVAEERLNLPDDSDSDTSDRDSEFDGRDPDDSDPVEAAELSEVEIDENAGKSLIVAQVGAGSAEDEDVEEGPASPELMADSDRAPSSKEQQDRAENPRSADNLTPETAKSDEPS